MDYQIKNAIIKESRQLREALDAAGSTEQDYLRANSNGNRDVDVPWHLVPSRDAGMGKERTGGESAESDEPGEAATRYVYSAGDETPESDIEVGT